MYRRFSSLIVLATLMAGCVDLTAVGNFAKESSSVASNGKTLDASDAQNQVIDLASEAGVPLPNTIESPLSQSFIEQQAVTNAALSALSKYMQVLADLTAKNNTVIGTDFSSISTSLTSLHVSDANVQSGLTATQALVNLFTSGLVKYTTRTLILAAAGPVNEIAGYLANQAQVVANTYTDAANLSDSAWTKLMASTGSDLSQCVGSNLCRTVYRLGHRASAADRVGLLAKASVALQAKTAFLKIQKDHRALVANVDNLSAQNLIAELKADEPDLRNAIKGLQGI